MTERNPQHSKAERGRMSNYAANFPNWQTARVLEKKKNVVEDGVVWLVMLVKSMSQSRIWR
jgi:hypothetical protein